jgi:hypothetical protein
MRVYVVQAYRFGDLNNHSYIAGVYTTKEMAMDRAKFEEDFRGGKYACRVYGFELGKSDMEHDIEMYETDFFKEESERNARIARENKEVLNDPKNSSKEH